MAKKIFILILVDQITKLLFWNRDFFMGPIAIHSVKNFGLGFSLNFGLLNNIIILTGAMLFFVYYYWKNKLTLSTLGRWALALIIAGAISNIADRIYLSYVRDFIDLHLNFTFNLADVFIVIGLVLLILNQPARAEENY